MLTRRLAARSPYTPCVPLRFKPATLTPFLHSTPLFSGKAGQRATRWRAWSSKPPALDDALEAKPVSVLTADEFQQWLLTDEQIAPFVRELPKLSGASYVAMTEESLLAFFGPQRGQLLANKLRDKDQDPWLWLERVWPGPRDPELALIQPPTATKFPYQEVDRMSLVEQFAEEVLTTNWKAFAAGQRDDKKAWVTSFFYGTSGVGKTRFCLELLGLLKKYALSNSHAMPKELVEALSCSKTVVLDLVNNGYSLCKDTETKWNPETILGLRLARGYWFPNAPYPYIRQKFEHGRVTDPSLEAKFALSNVLRYIEFRPAAPTSRDPEPKIPRVLHIAVDEIQAAFDFPIPSPSSSLRKEEPLATALNRALHNAASHSNRLFVIPTFSGTTADAADMQDPTSFQSVKQLVRPLSHAAAIEIVKSFHFEGEDGEPPIRGQDWLAQPGVDRLISAIGGNARAIECLETVLRSFKEIPSPWLPLDKMLDTLQEKVSGKFGIRSLHRDDLFLLLLALAGIPVHPTTSNGSRTVRDLERVGIAQLRPPPQPQAPWDVTWKATADDLVLMDIPYVIARAALKAVMTAPDFAEGTEAKMVSDLAVTFFSSAAAFEEFTLNHRVLRHCIASLHAQRQGQTSVPARDLFCGTLCARAFTELNFEILPPTQANRFVSKAAGEWCLSGLLSPPSSSSSAESTEEVPTSIDLQNGGKQPLSTNKPFASLLSGNNLFDGILNERLAQPQQQQALIFIDAKHTQRGLKPYLLSANQDVAPLITKRRQLSQRLPGFEHILYIVTNKHARLPGGSGPTFESLAKDAAHDPLTCIATAADDSLDWQLSPTFARFFLATWPKV